MEEKAVDIEKYVIDRMGILTKMAEFHSDIRNELQRRMDAGELSDEERIEVLKADLKYQELLDKNITINGKSVKDIKEERTASILSPIFNILKERNQQLLEKQES